MIKARTYFVDVLWKVSLIRLQTKIFAHTQSRVISFYGAMINSFDKSKLNVVRF
jgi:hypothetical protein